ncbi:MAG: DNA-protecting protein DprA [Cellvibrio sp.]|jgi:DNA processing protein|nr:DNA-protecting protein DprA [Cellvibrio sp.]
MNTEHPLFASLFLQRLPETGAGIYWRLLDAFGSAEKTLEAPLAHLQTILKPAALDVLKSFYQSTHSHPLTQLVFADIDRIGDQSEIRLLKFEDAAYPELLRQITNPPPLLFVRGNVNCLALPQIAIVGSRNPSAGGCENAEKFAQYLAKQGFAITSGLALGVDGAAHRGALSAWGKTIAVMGTAVDRIYPARHRALAQDIIEKGGALISEFPLGTGSYAGNFPQRNRIISGLSLGTLVVEAAVQSGSLITAKQALEQNREVFAIPGSIHNPLAKGCHQLIRQGATLVESAQDILDQLNGMLSFKWQEAQQTLDLSEQKEISQPDNKLHITNSPETDILISAIGYDPVTLDALVERTQMPINQLITQLTLLELAGKIESLGGSYQRC